MTVINIKIKEKQKQIIYELECKRKLLTNKNSGILKSIIKFDYST